MAWLLLFHFGGKCIREIDLGPVPSFRGTRMRTVRAFHIGNGSQNQRFRGNRITISPAYKEKNCPIHAKVERVWHIESPLANRVPSNESSREGHEERDM